MARSTVLARYVVAAALVRTAEGGAAVGLVALAVDVRRDAGDGAVVGSLLAALLIAPAVLGPVVARPLDRARDARVPLAVAFVLFGGGLAGGAWLLAHASVALAAVPITVAGGCVPVVTGGLSSRLALLVGTRERTLRRAEGWDTTTYGLAATVGPGVVAALLGQVGALHALLALGCIPVAAAGLVATLPLAHAAGGGARGWPTRRIGRVLLGAGPLRRVLLATLLTEFGTAGIPVVAVVIGTLPGGATSIGAALAAVYGAGNLVGSLSVTALPMRGEPERLTLRCVVLVGVAVGLCAFAPGLPATVAAFALAGAAQAVLVSASFAVRSSYAPPPARAQVFATMAGIKMGAGAAGIALTGHVLRFGPRQVLAAGAALALTAATFAVLDRRSRPRSTEYEH
ncbi:hypothetical protein [Pseudonocardia acaciae]|uniref:hypothetical protein n=1 Tax=Pseudonocardia acaciae TaxID=551276 RepID=UPI00055E96B3|nr:hypothetical protein [Pseudonocardia acaciae]